VTLGLTLRSEYGTNLFVLKLVESVTYDISFFYPAGPAPYRGQITRVGCGRKHHIRIQKTRIEMRVFL
jgi:hypothetical protein